MRVELSPDAVAELNELRTYSVETWGSPRTRRYMAGIRAGLRWLAFNHAQGRRRREFVPEALSITRGRHVIFYEVDRRVLIIRILHDQRDSRFTSVVPHDERGRGRAWMSAR